MTDHEQNEDVAELLNDGLASDVPGDAEARMRGRLQELREKCDSPPRPASAERRSQWRPWRFGLRTVLALMVLACVPPYLYLRPYLAQASAAKRIERLGGKVATSEAGPEWLRTRFGSGLMRNVVTIDVADCDDPSLYMSDVLMCSQLEVLAVGGDAFTDQQIARLSKLPMLRGLVLDSTGATSEAVDELKKSLPKLEIRHSWRRIEEAFGDAASFETGTFPEYQNDGFIVSFELPMMPHAGPDWLRKRTNEKYFKDLIGLRLEPSATDDDLEWLPRLYFQTLKIYGSKITDRGMAKLNDSGRRQLIFNYSDRECLFTEKGLHALMADKSGKDYLQLAGVPLADSDLSFLAGQQELHYLLLSDAQIRDEQLAVLEGLPLRELTLNDNPITDACFEHLAKLKVLKTIWMFETNVTADGVNAFVAERPHLRVIWGERSKPRVAR